MNARPSLVSFESSAACAALSCTSRPSGTSGATASTSSAADVPSFAAIEIASNWSGFCSTFCAVGTSKIASVAPPSESTSP